MYRSTAFPSHWLFAHMMNHGSIPPPYAVTFYAGCPEFYPLVGLDPSIASSAAIAPAGLSIDLTSMDPLCKKALWNNKCASNMKVPSIYGSNANNQRDKDHQERNKTSPVGKSRYGRPKPGLNYDAGNNAMKNPYSGIVYNKGKASLAPKIAMDHKGVKRHLDYTSGSKLGDDRSPSPIDRGQMACKRKYTNNSQTSPPIPKFVDHVRHQNYVNSPVPCLHQSPSSPSSVIQYNTKFKESNSYPATLFHGNDWDGLSREIWDKYVANKQTEELYNRKMRLHDVLYRILTTHFPSCGLYVVGSSMNGFGHDTSDIDMCLMLAHADIDQKVHAINILKHVHREFYKCSFVQKVELIRAKVPILKFTDNVSGVDVDLNVNNSVGIRNTHLLYSYSNLDWRVRPLVLIVKMWARAHDINDAKNMTISSYSLTLMVIHYLQAGVSPPVLPCLHQLFQNKFLPDSDITSLVLEDDVCVPPGRNTQSLGELLVGFLDYYTYFKFSEDAISVRLGKRVHKFECQFNKGAKNNPGQWKYLSIEEPFDLTNTARSVYDDQIFERVKRVFRESYHRIKRCKELSAILER